MCSQYFNPINTTQQKKKVSEHSELMWLLGCHSNLGELERLPQFRTKASDAGARHFGLFSYPVLQTADILLFKFNTHTHTHTHTYFVFF